MVNHKGILIGLFALALGFFSFAIEYYFKVGFIAYVGAWASSIIGIISFVVQIKEMERPKK